MDDHDEAPLAHPIRILLADDHRLFREGVASLLDRTGDILLVGRRRAARRPSTALRNCAPISC